MSETANTGPTWVQVFTLWPMVKADLLQTYGVDVDDRQQMAGRSWGWLRHKITQLFTLPPAVVYRGAGAEPLVIPPTRIGWRLQPRPTQGTAKAPMSAGHSRPTRR